MRPMVGTRNATQSGEACQSRCGTTRLAEEAKERLQGKLREVWIVDGSRYMFEKESLLNMKEMESE